MVAKAICAVPSGLQWSLIFFPGINPLLLYTNINSGLNDIKTTLARTHFTRNTRGETQHFVGEKDVYNS